MESTDPRFALSQRPYRSIRQDRFKERSAWPHLNSPSQDRQAILAQDGSGTLTENTKRPPGRITR